VACLLRARAYDEAGLLGMPSSSATSPTSGCMCSYGLYTPASMQDINYSETHRMTWDATCTADVSKHEAALMPTGVPSVPSGWLESPAMQAYRRM
jgi:hypothetical protein